MDYYKDDPIFKTQIEHMIKVLRAIRQPLLNKNNLPREVSLDFATCIEDAKLDKTPYSKGVRRFLILRDYERVLDIFIQGMDKRGI